MPNIAALLKSEISRLSRREIRKEVRPLRKLAAAHRREIAAMKRALASLERRVRQSARQAQTSRDIVTSDEKQTRFVAKGLVSLRKRLGLSASDLARLLGVSMQSVYNWEHKKATPRKEQVAAIAALRGTGKREAYKRLEGQVPSRARTTVGKRLPKQRGVQKRLAKTKLTKRARRPRAK